MENWNNRIQNISNKFDNQSLNKEAVKKNIVAKFDFEKDNTLEQQKQEIFDQWDNHEKDQEYSLEKSNLIKQDLNIKIDPSQFKKWYTKNNYPNGVEMKVNKEVGKILKPFTINDTSSIIQEYDGRKFVLVDVDGIELPFYSSSSGKDEKNKGDWYPFYGFSKNGWVMKDGFDKDNNWKYNSEASAEVQERIKETAEFLSENISLPLDPSDWIDNLQDYFSYQLIDDLESRVKINNALGLPEDFDTKDINTNSGFEEIKKIKKYLLEKNKPAL